MWCRISRSIWRKGTYLYERGCTRNILQRSPGERIISYLAKVKNITLEQAMDIYYSSHLAQKIHEGKDDVQYLDYKVLVQILLDTEPVDSGTHYMDA